ncbi:hypothetical protein ABT294_00665 [Nonomuraea sp. NPDC000554]|uniref:hypothetical protein n=1 Tax=Nonomuraea sp. NPDC000554 TaxID=3154259 RepID=UPI00332DCE43
MALDCPVAICDRIMPGSARICGACTAELHRELEAVPGLAEDLDLAISRQTRLTSGSVGGRSPEKPLPWNERASEAADHLAAILLGWARVLVASVHVLHGPTCGTCSHPSCMYVDLGREPHHHPAHVAAWLHRHAGALIAHPAGPDAVEEILTAARNARYATDTPPRDLIYAGACDVCDADLYARPDAARVTCRWCRDEDGDRLVYEVQGRRDWMLQALEERELPAPAIARALTSLIRPIKPALLHTWVARRKLQPSGLDDLDRMLFRVGDVIDLMTPVSDTKRGERVPVVA